MASYFYPHPEAVRKVCEKYENGDFDAVVGILKEITEKARGRTLAIPQTIAYVNWWLPVGKFFIIKDEIFYAERKTVMERLTKKKALDEEAKKLGSHPEVIAVKLPEPPVYMYRQPAVVRTTEPIVDTGGLAHIEKTEQRKRKIKKHSGGSRHENHREEHIKYRHQLVSEYELA